MGPVSCFSHVSPNPRSSRIFLVPFDQDPVCHSLVLSSSYALFVSLSSPIPRIFFQYLNLKVVRLFLSFFHPRSPSTISSGVVGLTPRRNFPIFFWRRSASTQVLLPHFSAPYSSRGRTSPFHNMIFTSVDSILFLRHITLTRPLTLRALCSILSLNLRHPPFRSNSIPSPC